MFNGKKNFLLPQGRKTWTKWTEYVKPTRADLYLSEPFSFYYLFSNGMCAPLVLFFFCYCSYRQKFRFIKLNTRKAV